MKKVKIENRIMKKINNEKIQMKPKWHFKLYEGLMRGGWVILLMSGSLLLASVVYLLVMMNPKELLEFGSLGIEIITEDFPYLLLFGGLGIVISSTILFSRIGENYKRTTRKLIFWMSVLVILTTVFIYLVRFI